MTDTVLDDQHLQERLARMRQALDACPTEVPASLAIPARTGMDEVAKRLALGVDHTVVAFFGGTGSGKSSLFNAITQLDFADVGARRPTTSRAAACTWGDDAVALLDFLGVNEDRRIRRDSLLDATDQDDLEGLVLLDVPDYDSVTTAHALQVDRLVPLADILVWVVDPQKYADAALHEGYLRGLGARQEDMLILVNQIDTLPATGVNTLLADVRELLDADGLRDVQVLPVSAVRGDNLGTFRTLLRERVARESNAARTASAEMDAIARRLRPTVAERLVRVEPALVAETTTALIQASGAAAVEDSVRAALAHALPRSLARPEPPSRATVASIQTTWLRRTTHGLPLVWLRSVEESVISPEALAAQSTEAVGSVPLPGHRAPLIDLSWWGGILLFVIGLVWGGIGLSQGTVEPAAAAVGLVGLLMLSWSAYQRRVRARREATHYGEQVRSRLDTVVGRGLEAPATEVLGRHRLLQSALGLPETPGPEGTRA
ncbi:MULTISPECIES: GTPase [unclassified Actinomyces]|uniref:GTPase n=1 Tax=unclassified Actinomyces TaxID=2609248 RepID=UPI000D038FB8|nr:MULTISPECIES: GTPase [unclassified Actinomyces]AVM61521.1 ATP-binding protein [Actinomyces sp. oral taxon 897]QQO78254.1 50S ribosome-binding GTPase [Actinomyces sp. HMT897]